jgi:beta-lactamase class A
MEKMHASVYPLRHIEQNDTLSINGEAHFPVQSVFKFHIALATLHLVDQGKVKWDQKVYIDKRALMKNTHSPMRDKYPEGNVSLPLLEVLRYMVSESDNNACDILLKYIGGTAIVQRYMTELGICNVSIEANEEEMHKEWNVQFKNWTTPNAASQLLDLFYRGQILHLKSYEALWEMMVQTPTGRKRIKEQLPQTIIVAHKTGTSGVSDQGQMAAVNDIAIISLPDQHVILSVFVTDSSEPIESNEKMISDIGKVVFDFYNQP